MGSIGPQESGRGNRKAEGAPHFAGGGEGVSTNMGSGVLWDRAMSLGTIRDYRPPRR